jgi:hypothetical protein
MRCWGAASASGWLGGPAGTQHGCLALGWGLRTGRQVEGFGSATAPKQVRGLSPAAPAKCPAYVCHMCVCLLCVYVCQLCVSVVWGGGGGRGAGCHIKHVVVGGGKRYRRGNAQPLVRAFSACVTSSIRHMWAIWPVYGQMYCV